MVTFVFKGEAKLRAAGGDFAVLDYDVQVDHFADAQIPQAVRGALNDHSGCLLPRLGAGTDELNNFVGSIRNDAVLRTARFLLMSKQCRADTLVPLQQTAVREHMREW